MSKNGFGFMEGELQKFYDAAKNAPATEYEDTMGRKHYECPGAYNDEMVRCMARDMLMAHLSINAKDEILGKITESWMPKMTTHNTELMRRFDDWNGDRPMKAPLYKKALKFAAQIEDVMHSKAVQESPIKDLEGKMEAWKNRLLYQNILEYDLRYRDEMKYDLMQSQMDEYDSDGNHTAGLTQKDKDNIKTLVDTRERLLDAFIKIPVTSPLSEACRNQLETLKGLTNAIMEDWNGDPGEDPEARTDMADNNASGEIDDEDKKNIEDVLTAIQTVATELKHHVNGKDTENIPLEDNITTCHVLLGSLKNHLDTNDLSPQQMSKISEGTSRMLRKLADELETAAILA